MANWRDDFTEQEHELIHTAQVYAANNLKGMGGHHMAMLNAKLVAKLDAAYRPIPDVLIVSEADAEAVKGALAAYYRGASHNGNPQP